MLITVGGLVDFKQGTLSLDPKFYNHNQFSEEFHQTAGHVHAAKETDIRPSIHQFIHPTLHPLVQWSAGTKGKILLHNLLGTKPEVKDRTGYLLQWCAWLVSNLKSWESQTRATEYFRAHFPLQTQLEWNCGALLIKRRMCQGKKTNRARCIGTQSAWSV